MFSEIGRELNSADGGWGYKKGGLLGEREGRSNSRGQNGVKDKGYVASKKKVK